jgi:hypothetical protein
MVRTVGSRPSASFKTIAREMHPVIDSPHAQEETLQEKHGEGQLL